MVATVALVAVVGTLAVAAGGHRSRSSGISSIGSRLRKVLRLSENNETNCLGSQLSMNFGSGLTKFDLDEGNGSIVKSCPFGASNPTGKIHFECLPSGMWNLTKQDCYDCP